MASPSTDAVGSGASPHPAARPFLIPARNPRVARARRPLAIVVLGVVALKVVSDLGAFPELKDVFDTWVFVALMLVATGLCAARAIFHRQERAAWGMFAAALASSTVGQIVWALFYEGQRSPPVPNAADVFWLAVYPLLVAGVVLLTRSQFPRVDLVAWIDGLLVAMAVATIGLIVLFYPVLNGFHGSELGIVVTVSYPLGAILVLGCILGVFAITGWRPTRAWTLLGAALALAMVSDGAATIASLKEGYHLGSLIESGYVVGSLAIGLAAWVTPESPREVEADDWRTGILPELVILFALLQQVLAMSDVLGDGDYPAADVLALATIALGAVQMAFGPWYARKEARIDSLTGLRNRRGLLEDLARADAKGAPARALVVVGLPGLGRKRRTEGHDAGDAAVIELAERLAETLEGRGRAYRSADDELAGVFDEDSAEHARQRVDGAIGEARRASALASQAVAVELSGEWASSVAALEDAERRADANPALSDLVPA